MAKYTDGHSDPKAPPARVILTGVERQRNAVEGSRRTRKQPARTPTGSFDSAGAPLPKNLTPVERLE